jgi:hypothetical protein
MPARDGSGPMKVGSGTGRGPRRRGRAVGEATAVADPYRDCALGWGCWPRAGGRGRRSGGRGGRRGQGSARSGRRAEGSADPADTARQRKTFLERRMSALTEELDRVRALLSEYSRSEARGEEQEPAPRSDGKEKT